MNLLFLIGDRMWRSTRQEAERQKGEWQSQRKTRRRLLHLPVIDAEYGSFAKADLRGAKRLPSSYLINTMFANYSVLIDVINSGFEKTIVAEFELQFDKGKLKMAGPRRLTYKEIRRIRMLIETIKGEESKANGRRERFFKKISAILTRDKKKNS
jgi:hypothetical protein